MSVLKGLNGLLVKVLATIYLFWAPFLGIAHSASLDLSTTLAESPILESLPTITLSPSLTLCPADLPNPEVELVGTENYTANGKHWVRYILSVTNRDEYPDYLFYAAPNLPPCGLNTNSSRTWVSIVDQDGNYVYGFCALGSPEDMDGLWFAVEEGSAPPPGIKVVINDRYCEKEYESSLVKITPSSFSPPPTSDLELQSKWTSTPPVIDGVITSGEWDGAGSLVLYDVNGLERGTLYVKNDSSNLYVLLDMTGDKGEDSSGDYSGLAFDIGTDGVKSPYVDLRFARTTTGDFGIQWVMSEYGWTGIYTSTASDFAAGFGSFSSEASSHRIYEYRLAFSEINIDFDTILAGDGPIFQARMSVEAVSSTPSFRVYYPSHYNSFKNPMIRIALGVGTMSVASDAPIIAGIGLVPRTFIDQSTGLATTGPSDQFANLKDSPFGGHLRVMGNVSKLSALGIKYYAIGYCNMELYDCAPLFSTGFNLDHWQFLQDTRTNYYWDATKGKYILDAVSPETIYSSSGYLIRVYPVLSPSLDWYIPNLLFDWRTTGTTPVNSGLYRVHFFGFGAKDIYSFIPTDIGESTMVVRIDNTRPILTVNSISYKGNDVGACAIVRLEDANDTIEVNISAYDPDGYLRDFNLHALYGDGQSFTCHQETYSGYLSSGGTGPTWNPAMPSGTYSCQGDALDHWETTCGYTFRITGWDRAINGYSYIHYSADHETITILMPDYELCQTVR